MQVTMPKIHDVDSVFNGTIQKSAIEQHSIFKSIFLHLMPGVLIAAFYILVAPIFISNGYPPIFSLCLSILVILVPLELGFLLYQGKRLHGRISLNGVISYREPVPFWSYPVYGIIIILCSALSFLFTKPISTFLAKELFSWAPRWYVEGGFEGSRSVLITTFIMIMVLANIVGPAIEEIYFRGYLLPRMGRFKKWSPLANTVLFTIYHFWSPWELVTRIIGVFPLSIVAYKTRNMYIGMVAHIVLNILSSLSLISMIN